jgi:CHAT domain-containing protein
VLSSCDAGIGQEHQSEGMLSIARAFSFAGCSSIISTLWATNDESASILTQRLHYYLKKGYSKDIALQKAKIDFIEKDFAKKYNHPYFWSNLILIGDDEPVFQNSFSKVPVIIGVLILLVLGLTYFFYKEKRNVTF